jgi:hypothetical protein
MNGTWGEYLSFRRMITPVFIQVIFWFFAVVAVIAGIVVMVDDSFLGGLAVIIFGPLLARIYAELLIVIFRINDGVSAIARGTGAGTLSTQVALPATPSAPPLPGREAPGATQPDDRPPIFRDDPFPPT